MAGEDQFPDAPPDWVCEELLQMAASAALRDEIPIAAGIYRIDSSKPELDQWQRIAIRSNETITRKDPLAHAEILAIHDYRKETHAEYLSGIVLVTTLEPCLHCTGALLLARIDAVYFFARSDKGIRMCDVIDLSLSRKAQGLRAGSSNHHPEILPVDSRAERSSRLLEAFFSRRRSP